MDCTVDLYLQSKAITLEYIRILKKGCILPYYKNDYFRENEKKAKDVADANKRSFRQSCKSAAFSAYDKTAQLQMTDRLAEQLVDKNVLRLEAELKRPAMKKHLGKLDSNYHYLKNGAKQGSKIIKWYLKRMFKNSVDSRVAFAEAVDVIQNASIKEKTKERLVYLLRKTSDSSLDKAIIKTREKFNLTSSQISRLILR